MLSKQIKKFLNENKIKNSVTTHHGTVTVIFKSPVSEEIRNAVKEMETVKAHGDLMDDTRYYTGVSIQFRYEFEASEEELKLAEKIYNSWSEEVQKDHNAAAYHIGGQMKKELGPVANVILPTVYKIY